MAESLDELLEQMEQSIGRLADQNDILKTENGELAARLGRLEAEMAQLREEREATEGRISGIIASLDAIDSDETAELDVEAHATFELTPPEPSAANDASYAPELETSDGQSNATEETPNEPNVEPVDSGGMDDFFRGHSEDSDDDGPNQGASSEGEVSENEVSQSDEEAESPL
ncbi:MAG: hypothetical protein HOH43_21510 [Candidatus Latescibacteria bacterium]|jgi:chromosome segregation ATPase|nr:hypothetical protein [Candidatus Latescibacterota bacterium]